MGVSKFPRENFISSPRRFSALKRIHSFIIHPRRRMFLAATVGTPHFKHEGGRRAGWISNRRTSNQIEGARPEESSSTPCLHEKPLCATPCQPSSSILSPRRDTSGTEMSPSARGAALTTYDTDFPRRFESQDASGDESVGRLRSR